MNQWMNLFTDADFGATTSPETTIFALLFTFMIGQFIAWIYIWTHRGLSYSQGFISSIVLMPSMIALMMIIMAGSVVVAFGLLAVFAVVRFRNVLKDTRDTMFVLWSILEGLGVGTMRYSTSLIAAVGIAAIILYLRFTDFGHRLNFDATLNIRVAGDLAQGKKKLDDVLNRYSTRLTLTNERRRPENQFDLTYRLLMRDPKREEDLRADLINIEGISHPSLVLRTEESEV
jgi:hypothetical protein